VAPQQIKEPARPSRPQYTMSPPAARIGFGTAAKTLFAYNLDAFSAPEEVLCCNCGKKILCTITTYSR
jgi:hypothetical protein